MNFRLKENPLNNLYSEEFISFVSQYKFVISFENSICDDYITEKFWRPLIAGSIPVYLGSPTIKVTLLDILYNYLFKRFVSGLVTK